MRGRKGSKEDTMLLCKYLLKYKNWEASSAISELSNIDFIKNNYTKYTLYNYIAHMKQYLQTSVKPKNCPQTMIDCFNTLTKIEPRQEFIEIMPKKIKKIKRAKAVEKEEIKEVVIEKVEVSELDKIEAKLTLIETNYKKAKESIIKQQAELNNKLNLINENYNKLHNELEEKKFELLNKEVEEMLLKGV